MAAAIDGLRGSGPKQDWVDTPKDVVAGYQPPSQGPFRCDNCEYFSTKNGGDCSHKAVIKELGNIKGFPDRAKVDAAGCCNHFKAL